MQCHGVVAMMLVMMLAVQGRKTATTARPRGTLIAPLIESQSILSNTTWLSSSTEPCKQLDDLKAKRSDTMAENQRFQGISHVNATADMANCSFVPP